VLDSELDSELDSSLDDDSDSMLDCSLDEELDSSVINEKSHPVRQIQSDKTDTITISARNLNLEFILPLCKSV
jgi:hypothetical protein